MNTTLTGTVNRTAANQQQTAFNASRHLVGIIAVLLLIALIGTVWVIVSTSVPSVSAAGKDTLAPGEVPYFPSQYVNQASEPSPAAPTF